MSTFFQQTAQAMIAKHIDRFPLLKLDQVIDWQPIEQYLNRQRTRYLRDHRGRPAYPLLSMFKAVLLGQWHSLSDPELEHSLTLQMLDPEIAIEFDSDPKQARASRQDALKDAATRKIWIAGAHMPFPGIEHIRAESNGATLGCRWNIPRSKSTAKCNNLTKTDRTFLRGSRQMTAFLCYGDFSL